SDKCRVDALWRPDTFGAADTPYRPTGGWHSEHAICRPRPACNPSSAAAGRPRAAVDIGRGVVDKRLQGKAPLRRETLVTVGLGHVGDDGVCLAGLQRLAIVVAHMQR